MPNAALLPFAESMHRGLDVTDADTFWCMADPGWALGLYIGIAGPLLLWCCTMVHSLWTRPYG